MKKFVFSLDALYKVRKAMKDSLQAEYSAAAAALEEARARERGIQDTLTAETQCFEAKMKNGMTAGDLQVYCRFIEELRQKEKAASAETERAAYYAGQKRAELVDVFKEVKTIEKLREKQYEAFITEEEKEENKALDNLISYNIAGKRPD